MALRISLRKTFSNYIISCIRAFQTSSSNLEKAMENLRENPYFDKYADRIAALQKTSPEQFLQRVDHQHKAKEEERKNKFAAVDTRQYSSVLNPKKQLEENHTTHNKKLEEIFKIEMVQDKDATDIQKIWEEYHLHKEVISATIPIHLYGDLHENMTQLPTFLFPLPRAQGYEFIMSQTHGHTVHFTPLLAYQVHKENAPECLTMVHYTELSDKGIVLMRGEYDKNVLNGQEAQCLANQFQLYYGGRDAHKLRLLRAFSREPAAFRHMDLVDQLENIALV